MKIKKPVVSRLFYFLISAYPVCNSFLYFDFSYIYTFRIKTNQHKNENQVNTVGSCKLPVFRTI